MKYKKKFPVFLLIAAAVALCILLGKSYFQEEKQIAAVKNEKDGFTLLCPKLAHCADAFILYNGKEAVMIDTGESGDADILLDILREEKIDTLDALILTHYDKDHIGGAPAVLENVRVKKCYTTCGTEDSDEYRNLLKSLDKSGTRQIIVTGTEEFSLLDASFTIYPPLTEDFIKNRDNNLSLMISVKGLKDSLLFAGDAQQERMLQFVENQYDGTAYTWLKVPHHGRDKKPVKMLLDCFVPEDAVICSSLDEPENKEVTALLKKKGVKVGLTRKGDLTFSVPTSDRDISRSGNREEPASRNSDEKKESVHVEKPVFSRQSGFYKKKFSLEITAQEGSRIYYTLDSSEPTEDSLLYTGKISVKDVSLQPNIHSARTDLQPYLPIARSVYHLAVADGWYARSILPDTVDKCQIVRAIAVDKDGNRSEVVTASYFIGYQKRMGYDDIAVLSLVSDPEDLFNEDSGILVNGRTYKEKWMSGELDGIQDSHITRKFCNTYFGRGREWERKVHLDYFEDSDKSDSDKSDSDKALVFSQEAGIRLHGNQSRVAESQKSFNLYARKDYDGNKTFLAPFYEDGILQDRVILMRGNDIRNYFLSKRMNRRTMDTQNYKLVQVFLDGEYWGVYAIQEKYNSKEYLRTHYNLEKEDYVLAKGTHRGFEIKNGDPDATRTSFRIVRDFIKEKDLSDEANYQELCRMMDMQSFIDGYAARLYTGDQDWSWFKNQYLLFYDQKWHWLVFDIDYGAGKHEGPDTNTFLTPRFNPKYSLENDPLFPYLMKNEEFRQQFTNTFLDLGNEVFEGKKIRKEADRLCKKYNDAFILESKRYPTVEFLEENNNPQYISEIHYCINETARYFEERLSYASDYVANYFGFTGKTATVTLNNVNPEGGSIRLNSITPELNDDNQWSGTYFTDCPVTLTAEPEEGWAFGGWETDNGELKEDDTGRATMSFSEDVTVKARFYKEMK